MANARREFLKKNKRARMKDLKISYTGVAASCCSLIALGVAVTAVVYAFLFRGDADIMTACLGLVGLVFAVGSIFLGLASIREPQVRMGAGKFGTIMGVIMTIVLMAFYVSGIVA